MAKKANAAFMKPLTPSEDLAKVVGATAIATGAPASISRAGRRHGPAGPRPRSVRRPLQACRPHDRPRSRSLVDMSTKTC